MNLGWSLELLPFFCRHFSFPRVILYWDGEFEVEAAGAPHRRSVIFLSCLEHTRVYTVILLVVGIRVVGREVGVLDQT